MGKQNEKKEDEIESSVTQATETTKKVATVRYRNANSNKAELHINEQHMVVLAGKTVDIPVDQFDNVKPQMLGSWVVVKPEETEDKSDTKK